MGRIKAGILGLAAIAALAGELVLPDQSYKLSNGIRYEQSNYNRNYIMTGMLALSAVALAYGSVKELSKED